MVVMTGEDRALDAEQLRLLHWQQRTAVPQDVVSPERAELGKRCEEKSFSAQQMAELETANELDRELFCFARVLAAQRSTKVSQSSPQQRWL